MSFAAITFGTGSFATGKMPGERTKLTPVQRAVKTFNKEFDNSVTPVVHSTNDGIILKAVINGHNVTSAYSKNGSWVYTIEHYPSESLSKNIIDLVQKEFNSTGYYITTMKKIDQPGKSTVYLVEAQNSSTFTTLRVIENEVEVVSEFQKA